MRKILKKYELILAGGNKLLFATLGGMCDYSRAGYFSRIYVVNIYSELSLKRSPRDLSFISL